MSYFVEKENIIIKKRIIIVMTFAIIISPILYYLSTLNFGTFFIENNKTIQDYIITGENFSKEEFIAIKHIDNVENAERTYTTRAIIQNIHNANIELNFIETNDISNFKVIEGFGFTEDVGGIWLDRRFAETNGIFLGKELEISLKGYKFVEKVAGIIESPEYYAFNFGNYKDSPRYYAYLSIQEFPEDYLYSIALKTDDSIQKITLLRDIKSKINEDPSYDYSELLPRKDGIVTIRTEEALDLVDDIANHKEEFLKAINKRFAAQDYFPFSRVSIILKDKEQAQKTISDIRELFDKPIDVLEKENTYLLKSYNSNIKKSMAEVFVSYTSIVGILSIFFVFIVVSFVFDLKYYKEQEKNKYNTK